MGVCTLGRFQGPLQNRTLLGVFDMLGNIDVTGFDCLDLGAVDGITGFGLKLRGAARVVATDRSRPKNFMRTREALGLDVDHRERLEISAMSSAFEGRSFDLIVCAGVIYQMLNPFTAFQTCRQLLRPGGLLVMESACELRDRTTSEILKEMQRKDT